MLSSAYFLLPLMIICRSKHILQGCSCLVEQRVSREKSGAPSAAWWRSCCWRSLVCSAGVQAPYCIRVILWSAIFLGGLRRAVLGWCGASAHPGIRPGLCPDIGLSDGCPSLADALHLQLIHVGQPSGYPSPYRSGRMGGGGSAF